MNISPDDARRRILRRQIFFAALTTLLVIGPTIVIVYALTGPYTFFWPGFPLAGLLIATGYTAAHAFAGLPGDISDYEVERELRRQGVDISNARGRL